MIIVNQIENVEESESGFDYLIRRSREALVARNLEQSLNFMRLAKTMKLWEDSVPQAECIAIH